MTTRVFTRRLVSFGSTALIITTLTATLAAAPSPPKRLALAGTWEADLSHSTFKGRAPYRSGKMSFTSENGGKVHVINDVVTANGAAFHIEYVGPEDGTQVPVRGNPYYNKAAMVWKDKNTLVRTEFRGDAQTGKTTFVIAPDGKSFTASADRSAPEDGHQYLSVIVWKKIAD